MNPQHFESSLTKNPLHRKVFQMFLAFFAVSSLFCNDLQAQSPQFGTMPPQYQAFEWQKVEGRSFDFYHHQGGVYLAQYAAVSAEESYKVVQRVLGFSFSDKVDIFLYGSPNEALQSNVKDALVPKGFLGVNKVRRNRMVVAFEGDWFEFKRSLARELVRGAINTAFHGAALPQQYGGTFEAPEWYVEGLAEYIANDAVITPEADMALRDIISSDRITNFASLEAASVVPVGYAFFWYVGEKFGAGRISEFHLRIRALRSMESAFRTTFGMSQDGFMAVWKRELRDMINSDAAKYEDVDKIAQRVTDSDKDGSAANSDPVWSPVADKSGEKFAFLSAQGGVWQVMVQFEGKQKRVEWELSTGRAFDVSRSTFTKGASLLSWKPDGTVLAAVVSTQGKDGIVLVNPNTGTQQRLDLGFKLITGIAFAPDGKSIALTAVENESPNLYQFDIASKRLTRLISDVFTESEPTWSPDGKSIYFLSDRSSVLTVSSSAATVELWEHQVQSSDVYAYNLAQKRIERITTTPTERKVALGFSPDGKRLLFTSDRNGIYNLYDFNLATRTLLPRTSLHAGLRGFGISRDGTKLTFSALKKGAFNIFTLPAGLDRKIAEPEATPLRKQVLERESAAEKALGRASQLVSGENAAAADATIVQTAPDSLRGYGKVDLTFDRQKMVVPNPELLSQRLRQEAVESSDYTTPGKYPTAPVSSDLALVNWDWLITFDTFFSNSVFASGSALFGNSGIGAQALWSDVLGNNRLFAAANIMLGWSNNDVLVSYSYLPNEIDFEFQLFRNARQNFVIDQREPILSLLQVWGASAKAIMPLSETVRLEGKLALLNTVRTSDQASRVNRSDFVIAPELRFVLDNTETNFFGPNAGNRADVRIDGVPGLAGLSFARIIGDYRHYFPIKGFGTIAARLAAGTNIGDTPQNFFAGGQENTILGRTIAPEILPFNRAEDLYFMQTVMPMRAFSLIDAQGRNFAVANVELRVPLLSSENSSSFLSSIINGLQGAAFVDVGSAWTNPIRLNTPRAIFDTFGQYVGLADGDLLMSVGVGLRTFLLGRNPVKIDVAWQNLQTGLMLPRLTIALGYNF